jgi:peptidoglycan/LPS O-acetylase OafA/YrhL
VTASSRSSRSRSPHWPALDGWRGFTIWFAISVHAGYFTAGGVLSLDTFFVLSGFLITGLLLREWRDRDGIDLLAFWARRARRLLPALFVVLAAVIVYAAFVASPLGLDSLRGDVLATLGYSANWRFLLSGQSYFSAFTTPSPVLHMWSLAVEEQFYLVWPLAVLGILSVARRRMSATAAIVAVGVVAAVGAVASAVWMALLYVPGGDPSRVYYGTDTRAQAMLVGAVLAVVVLLHGPVRTRGARTALSIASVVGLGVVVAPWFAGSATQVHDFFYGRFGLLAYSVATAVVLWRMTQPSSGLFGRVLESSPLRWIGGISYEMYLWHWPTYLVLTPARTQLDGLPLLAVRLTAVVALSWATHALVDEPIRRGVRLHSPRLARSAVVMVVIVVSVGTFAATVGAEPALSGDVGQLVDRGGPPTVAARHRPATTSAGAATTTAPPAPIKLLVVGDSQAATLAQGLNADGGHHGLSMQPGVLVWNRAILGCPIISRPTVLVNGERLHNKCGGEGFWQRQWPDDVVAFRPDAVVVVAGAWDLYDIEDDAGRVVGPGDPVWTAGYQRDVGELFDVLHSTGAPVVAIEPPCFGHNEVPGTDPDTPERLDPARAAAVHRIWVEQAASHGATMADLDHVLCPNGTSDASIRPDGAHFFTAGADRMAPLVIDSVRAAMTAAKGASVVGPYAP